MMRLGTAAGFQRFGKCELDIVVFVGNVITSCMLMERFHRLLCGVTPP